MTPMIQNKANLTVWGPYSCSYFCLVCGGWACKKNPQLGLSCCYLRSGQCLFPEPQGPHVVDPPPRSLASPFGCCGRLASNPPFCTRFSRAENIMIETRARRNWATIGLFSRADPCSVDFGRKTPKFRFEFCGFFWWIFSSTFSKEKSTKKSPAKFTRDFVRKNSPQIFAEAFS